jgi:hypothetical protein
LQRNLCEIPAVGCQIHFLSDLMRAESFSGHPDRLSPINSIITRFERYHIVF